MRALEAYKSHHSQLSEQESFAVEILEMTLKQLPSTVKICEQINRREEKRTPWKDLKEIFQKAEREPSVDLSASKRASHLKRIVTFDETKALTVEDSRQMCEQASLILNADASDLDIVCRALTEKEGSYREVYHFLTEEKDAYESQGQDTLKLRYAQGKQALESNKFDINRAKAIRDKTYPISMVKDLIKQSDVPRRHLAPDRETAEEKAEARANRELQKDMNPTASVLVCNEERFASLLKEVLDLHSVTLETERFPSFSYRFANAIGDLVISNGRSREEESCDGFEIAIEKMGSSKWRLMHCRPLKKPSWI